MNSSLIIYRFDMADKIDLAEGCDSFRLANPPPWTACLNYASLEVSFINRYQTTFI